MGLWNERIKQLTWLISSVRVAPLSSLSIAALVRTARFRRVHGRTARSQLPIICSGRCCSDSSRLCSSRSSGSLGKSLCLAALDPLAPDLSRRLIRRFRKLERHFLPESWLLDVQLVLVNLDDFSQIESRIQEGRLMNGIRIVKDKRLPSITGRSLKVDRITRSKSSRCSPFRAQKIFPLKSALSHSGKLENLRPYSGLNRIEYTPPHEPHLHSPCISPQLGVM